jgi:hypothetical protein
MFVISILGDYFMAADKKTTETLRQDFSALNEANKRKIIEMTRFLLLTQDSIIPRLLRENAPAETMEESLEMS